MAVDCLPEFLEKLVQAGVQAGVTEKIKTLAQPMEELPFEDGMLDAIWSEGAIYNIGFEFGVKAWRSLLKLGGILAVSEITWLTQIRPDELQKHWENEYRKSELPPKKSPFWKGMDSRL